MSIKCYDDLEYEKRTEDEEKMTSRTVYVVVIELDSAGVARGNEEGGEEYNKDGDGRWRKHLTLPQCHSF